MTKIRFYICFKFFKQFLPELDEAIRTVTGYGGETPIVVDSIQSLEPVFNRYSIVNSNDWNTTLELKMTERRLNDDEKRYLQLTDRLILVAKVDNKNVIKPGRIVSNKVLSGIESRDLLPQHNQSPLEHETKLASHGGYRMG